MKYRDRVSTLSFNIPTPMLDLLKERAREIAFKSRAEIDHADVMVAMTAHVLGIEPPSYPSRIVENTLLEAEGADAE